MDTSTDAIHNDTSSICVNYGLIEIDDRQLQNDGEFQNLQEAKLILQNLTETGLLNNGDFTNRASVKIEDGNKTGLDNRGNFTNYGSIDILSLLSTRVMNFAGILNTGVFNNQIDGSIIIDGIYNTDSQFVGGIYNWANTFTNNGVVNIQNIDRNGILNEGNFVNLSQTTISSVLFGITNHGTFINDELLNLSE